MNFVGAIVSARNQIQMTLYREGRGQEWTGLAVRATVVSLVYLFGLSRRVPYSTINHLTDTLEQT